MEVNGRRMLCSIDLGAYIEGATIYVVNHGYYGYYDTYLGYTMDKLYTIIDSESFKEEGNKKVSYCGDVKSTNMEYFSSILDGMLSIENNIITVEYKSSNLTIISLSGKLLEESYLVYKVLKIGKSNILVYNSDHVEYSFDKGYKLFKTLEASYKYLTLEDKLAIYKSIGYKIIRRDRGYIIYNQPSYSIRYSGVHYVELVGNITKHYKLVPISEYSKYQEEHKGSIKNFGVLEDKVLELAYIDLLSNKAYYLNRVDLSLRDA